MEPEILIVEDSPHKRAKITDLVRSIIPDAFIEEACSYTAGCKAIEEKSFKLAIVDMTLPTYDRSDDEPGGRMRATGGREIARKLMKRPHLATRLLFVTQYRSFSDKARSHTFESLESELRADLKDRFVAMILFDSSQSAWRDQLADILRAL